VVKKMADISASKDIMDFILFGFQPVRQNDGPGIIRSPYSSRHTPYGFV
jgi:hypothetical protein